MEYWLLLLGASGKIIALVKNPKEFGGLMAFAGYTTAVIFAGTLCVKDTSELSMAAPCDEALLENQMIATSTSAFSADEVAAFLSSVQPTTAEIFELS